MNLGGVRTSWGSEDVLTSMSEGVRTGLGLESGSGLGQGRWICQREGLGEFIVSNERPHKDKKCKCVCARHATIYPGVAEI